MKPEAQASGADGGGSDQVRGTVLMLIGFGVGFAVCCLLVAPAKKSSPTAASPSTVSARVYAGSFLPLVRLQESDIRLMVYEYGDGAFQKYFGRDGDEEFRWALEKLNTNKWRKIIIMQSPGEFYQRQPPLLDAPSPGDWQQPRSLHLIDQRPARELVSVTQ